MFLCFLLRAVAYSGGEEWNLSVPGCVALPITPPKNHMLKTAHFYVAKSVHFCICILLLFFPLPRPTLRSVVDLIFNAGFYLLFGSVFFVFMLILIFVAFSVLLFFRNVSMNIFRAFFVGFECFLHFPVRYECGVRMRILVFDYVQLGLWRVFLFLISLPSLF